MKYVTHPAIVFSIVLSAACSGDERADSDTARATLDSAQLAALEAQYPRLGEEPLPEPQPSGERAAPSNPVLETGEATFYAQQFEGRRTASGIPFRHNQLVAAHRAYPFGTLLRVTNTSNQRSVNVRVVDRGPAGNSAHAQRTILDLSRRAADQLGYVQQGRARVKVEVLEWGRGIGA